MAVKKTPSKKVASTTSKKERKAAPERAAEKKGTSKKSPPGPRPAQRAAPAAKAKPAESAPSKKTTARRAPGSPPIEKTRVVFPMALYEVQKEAIKAPIKEHELEWNFLGAGKGLYKREDGGVHCFTQFKDDGVHYSVWGEDKKAVGALLATWRTILGESGWSQATATGQEAAVAEAEQKESDAVRLWRLGEPQRRPGEPDLFFEKRRAEWQAKRPG